MKISERQWTHMNGAGNSFFFLDGREQTVAETSAERSAFAKYLCTEVSGLRADGLVILEKADGVDFRWDFYNSDGSAAEMCGNAARCAVRFFMERVRKQDNVSFESGAGLIVGGYSEELQYSVKMPEIAVPGALRKLTIDGQQTEIYFINTGVPHLIVPSAPDRDFALRARRAPELGAAGSNVTFVEPNEEGGLKAVTFERGVDDFTLACGTGAVAAAAYALSLDPEAVTFTIQMPGGILRVEMLSETQPFLSGPAEIDFEVTLGDQK